MEWTARVRAALTQETRPRDTSVPDPDVVDELAQHAQAAYEAARADGASREDADARAGALIDRWRGEADALHRRGRRPAVLVVAPSNERRAWGVGLLQDVRYALRLAVRQPKPAAVTALTLALGIAATTILSAVAYAVLLAPLPWPNADRIVDLSETRGGNAPRFGALTNAVYHAWRDHPGTIDGLAAWSSRTATVSGDAQSERMRVTAASASLFGVLGVRPLIGATFTAADEATPVIVLSEGLWQQRFGGDPRAIGARIEVDGRAHTIVGVVSAAAMFPDQLHRAIVPLEVPPASSGSLSLFNAVALLHPGAAPAQAAAEGTARGAAAPDTGLTTTAIFGGSGPIAIEARSLRDMLAGDVQRAIVVLSIGGFLLLGTAIANVASLQLARATARQRELAIRATLGAGIGRVTRQLLIENGLLGVLGGLAGLGLAWVCLAALPSLLPADFPRLDSIGLDRPIVLFALAASLGSSVLVGLLPAAGVRRLSPSRALAEGGASATGVGVRTRVARTRLLIMAGQVTIACVLLVGASLLGRSFGAMLQADRGYDAAGVLSARLSLPAALFPSPERRYDAVDRVMARLPDLPGVSDFAFTSEIPLTAGGSTSGFQMRSAAAGGAIVEAQASPRLVSQRYFATLALRVTAGRGFAATDDAAAPVAVVVNESFARRYLGASPLGATLPVVGYGPMDAPPLESTVVGVVEDVRYVTGTRPSQPELYYDYRQLRGRLPVQTVTLLLRTPGDLSALVAPLRTIVHDSDRRLVADAIQPLDERLRAALAKPRLYAAVMMAFAAFAMAIAAAGLFGTLSYAVSQRARELAIRAALGAGRAEVFALVLRQGLLVSAAGAVAGLVGSASLTGLLSAQLYGIAPHDTTTFVVVPLILLVVGSVASLTPALRAARLDTLRVLRGD
jgi:putative ABC transport system permease protein